jgi:hypothetical protein
MTITKSKLNLPHNSTQENAMMNLVREEGMERGRQKYYGCLVLPSLEQ